MRSFRSPYPRYDVLAKWHSPSWNELTRRVVARRLSQVPDRRFFTEGEWRCLVALCESVLPQPERDDPVPIAPWIDEFLYNNRGRGTRYATMPSLRETWRRGLHPIDAEARRVHGSDFATLDDRKQQALLRAIDQGKVATGAWNGMPPQQFFRNIVLKEVVATYYAHPAAWNEIGFGGPASPRGYVRLDANQRDPWEAAERRPLPETAE